MVLKFIFVVLFLTFLPTQNEAIIKRPIKHSLLKLLNDFISCRCRCGLPNREGKMRGGEYIGGHEFPWLATVRLRHNISVNGVLINNRYILTAASPLIEYSPHDLKVTLGLQDTCSIDISSHNMSIEVIKIHPDFNSENRIHDLALLKVSTPIRFERRISPICLPFKGAEYLGKVAIAVGWSEEQTQEGNKIAICRPRKLGLPVLGHEECIPSVADQKYFTSDKGCVGVVGGPSYICPSDVGGPLMFRTHKGSYELIGIFPDINVCGPHLSTAIYTKLNYNMNWIKDTTRDSCYCSKFL